MCSAPKLDDVLEEEEEEELELEANEQQQKHQQTSIFKSDFGKLKIYILSIFWFWNLRFDLNL